MIQAFFAKKGRVAGKKPPHEAHRGEKCVLRKRLVQCIRKILHSGKYSKPAEVGK